ncbi:MAG: hypothetical protein R2709_01210 [Marmoricola sp.]
MPSSSDQRHPDVRLVSTELLSIGVDEGAKLVRLGALAPAGGGMQIVIIEDSDRLTEQAANALLKAIEEPNERTAWLLCAPTVEDVLPTIRSRARHVVLPHRRSKRSRSSSWSMKVLRVRSRPMRPGPAKGISDGPKPWPTTTR